MPKVTLILVTWNSAEHLREFFSSLLRINYPKHSWNLVIVDNGSQDETRKTIGTWQTKMHNLTTVIYNAQNLGFTKANNQGIQYALQNNVDYIALVNDDIVFTKDWLKSMVECMEKNKQVGLSQPLIMRYSEPSQVNSLGNAFQFTGFGYSFGDNVPLSDLRQQGLVKDYEPAYLSFACVVIRADLFNQIGLLDDKYFSYLEDADFCFRTRLQDWHLLVNTSAKVFHNYRTPFSKNKERYFWLEKNRFYLILKFYRAKTLLLITPACIFMEIGQIIYALAKGFFIKRLKTYFWVLANLLSIYQQRKRVQSSRQFGDYKLFDFMTGKILFQELDNFLLRYIANPILALYLKLIKKFI